jgi:hypothetical protein
MEMCETRWEIFARLPNAFLVLRFCNFIMSPKFGTMYGSKTIQIGLSLKHYKGFET